MVRLIARREIYFRADLRVFLAHTVLGRVFSRAATFDWEGVLVRRR